MVLSVTFTGAADGDDGPFALAPQSVWSAFAAWAESLPEDEFAAVRELALTGSAGGTDTLSAQLVAALESHPPAEAAVAGAARTLSETLGVGDPGETATVADDADEGPDGP